MSSTRKREVTSKLQDQFAVSERRASRVLGQPQSSQRRRPKRREHEAALVGRMRRDSAPTSALRLLTRNGSMTPMLSKPLPRRDYSILT